MFAPCLAYFSNLKKEEAVLPSETSLNCKVTLHGIVDDRHVLVKWIGLKWLRQVPVCCGSAEGVWDPSTQSARSLSN
jgi:hypothetical protein